MTFQEHVERVREAVLTEERLRPVGGGSKPALSGEGNFPTSEMSGVLEYNPQEYTFTALAGTPVKEVGALLAENGQYLPFDPPFADAGATLGGTVAAGLSGPGRYRYGGVRDFLLGVRFVSGEGRLVTGGGKVVKNAAGFDFPKLMVGSLGAFGVMVELTFKVFPRPEAYATLCVDLPSLEDALTTMQKLAVSPFELACLDLEPPHRLLLRVGGISEALPGRLERIQAFVGREGEVRTGEADVVTWHRLREFSWLPEAHALVKVALSPGKVAGLEGAIARLSVEVPRRYSVGGNVLYLAWPEGAEKEQLNALLTGRSLPGLALTGTWRSPLLGKRNGEAFMRRILKVLDPHGKFQSREVKGAA